MLSAAGSCELSTTTHVKTAWKKFKELLPVLSSCHLSHAHVQLLCVERNAPYQWDLAIDKAKLPASAAEWQGNGQTDLQCQAARHCYHQVQWATWAAWHWGSGPHSPLVWTCGTHQWCSQNSLSHTGWGKAWALEAQDDMKQLTERDCREWKLSAINPHDRYQWMIPGDLVWDLPCVQQASYVEGGPLMWMLSLYLHGNQRSDYDYG